MSDKYKQHACEFKNESECEEELDEAGSNMGLAEKAFYEEED